MRKSQYTFGHSIVSSSVRKKFLLATRLASMATLSLFGIAYVLHEKAAFIDQKAEYLQSLSKIVASNLEASLIFDDPFTATDYLNSLAAEKNVTFAALYRTQGDLFASYKRSPEIQILPPSGYDGTIKKAASVERSTAIETQGEHLGTLVIEVDMTSLQANMKKVIYDAIIVVGIGTLLSAFIANLLQKFITKPLLELEKFAKQVAQDGNYSRRAQKRFDDEIGSLAESINVLMEGVQQRDRAIHDHSRNLEAQVASRTSELREAMLQAKAASQAKSEFLSTMSHELRTPLNAIVGMSSVLASEDIDLELHNYVKIIQSSSDNLLSIINEILDYSKIESGNLEIETASFALIDCLEEAIDMVAALHWEKGIDFFVTIDPTLPHLVEGDVTRLRQVVINLLGNAAKFTKSGYVWLEAKPDKTKDSENANKICIAVHDTGIGIPEDRKNRLFQAFSQVDSTTTRKYGGTGLGLAISQKLVIAMGGLIEVSSTEGKGTTFSFALPFNCSVLGSIAQKLRPNKRLDGKTISINVPFAPLNATLTKLFDCWGLTCIDPQDTPDFSIESRFIHLETRPPAKAKEATLTIQHPLKRSDNTRGAYSNNPFRIAEARNFILYSDGPDTSTKKIKAKSRVDRESLPSDETRILLAEDNKVNQKVFKLIMKREGFKIDIAIDGQEAVAAMLKKQYDIIFMDLQMPNMDGLEACRRIRANTEIEQPWIIGFTANVESDAEPAMREAGMDDFLSKPVRDERVRQALQDYKANTKPKSVL